MSEKPTIKQRVKVSILPSSNAQEDIELDYRVLLTGDFSKSASGEHKDGPTLQDRRLRTIGNKSGFKSVLKELNPTLKMQNIKDKISGEEDRSLEAFELSFEDMKDFHPDQIAQKVPALRKLLEQRERLKQFKMDVRSSPELKKTIEKVLASDEGKGDNLDGLISKLASEEDEGEAE